MTLLNPPLHVSGASITDSQGHPVRLAGVNWGGAQQDDCVPYGLDKLHREMIADRIRDWGLNHVRLPFATGAFLHPDGSPVTAGAAPDRVAANPDLAGATPWEVYQAVVQVLADAGLAVIPNQHLHYPGWCCSEADTNGLWYNVNWPGATFTAVWELVAKTFADRDLVIGFDLHNEPRKATISGRVLTPSWGDGNPATDFRQLYDDTAVALRKIAPGRLYFCEGLSFASDLRSAGAHPVSGGDVVYSMHDYAWYHPAGQARSAYVSQMDAAGGYLVTSGKAPLWIGEFGIDTGTRAAMSTGWMADFLSWAADRDVHWCWWELGAQSPKDTEPSTNAVKVQDGTRETFGLMAGQDWLGSETEMLALLAPLM